jgi:hypothetical protein
MALDTVLTKTSSSSLSLCPHVGQRTLSRDFRVHSVKLVFGFDIEEMRNRFFRTTKTPPNPALSDLKMMAL